MRNLFALLVGINSYDHSQIDNLRGCLNDVEGMLFFLKQYCANNDTVNLHTRILKEENATRKALIDGFDLFRAANEQDVCLFYFSGHGSQVDAPNEFWNEVDQKLEALVCYGDDNLLLDKELSYLIANAQKGKALHFVVMTDCCHSGSNSKGGSFQIRSAPPNLDSRAVSKYHGRSSYAEIKNEAGAIVRLSPPIGKHFKLGACTSNELAKEKVLGKKGEVQGVFTYALLQVLKENGFNLNYSNLIRKTRFKVQALAKNQSPQVETIALEPQECYKLFLNGVLGNSTPKFQVAFKNNRWIIDVGQLYGHQVGDSAILMDGTEVRILKIYLTDSILDPRALAKLNRENTYNATIRSRKRRKLNLKFAIGCDKDSKNIMLTLMQEAQSIPIEFNENKDVDYVVHAYNNILALTHPEDSIPFLRINGTGESATRLFLKLVEQVSEWHHIITISNPFPTIKENEIQVELYKVENPHTYENPDMAPALKLEYWQNQNVYRYAYDENIPGGPWHPPEFRLEITNQSEKRPFWVSALYCGSGTQFDRTHYSTTLFSISNRFLEKERVEPGRKAKLTDAVNDPTKNKIFEYESIQLNMLDDYADQGYSEIKDLIKIFVATDELDTSPYNMNGIPIDTAGVLEEKRAPHHRASLPSDWRTFEIPITLVKPRDLGILRHLRDIHFNGVTLIGHLVFSARVILSSMEEFIRSTEAYIFEDLGLTAESEQPLHHRHRMPRPEIEFGNKNIDVIEFGSGIGEVEGCSVIEFCHIENEGSITNEYPLRLKIDNQIIPIEKSHKLILLGYSATNQKYYSLGKMNDAHEIIVEDLPDASPSLIDGLGSSIKIMLINVSSEIKISPWKKIETEETSVVEQTEES